MNTPRPALVTQEAARRLPRLALWLLCLAYVLPGFVGRQPWKGDDLASFGFMQAMAEGRTGWLAPQLDGLAPDVAALLPYWLGALAIQATAGWLAPDVAVRLPFALMLAGTLAATWYATYNLTRLPGAQPVALAFGGEAQPRDYARALADGSLLALIATLGMAQLAHETTPALAQLCFTALVFFGFAAMPFQPRAAVAATLLGLPALALSGAPTLALAYGAAAVLAQLWPGWQAAAPANALQAGARRRLLLATLAAMLASAALGWRLGLWRWQITWPLAAAQWRSLARLFAWFTWPIWPLALWTLWRWRAQLPRPRQQRHLGLPLMMAGMAMLAAVFTPARDRSLLAALPPLAALAALALPTLRRGMAALIDWFTVLFFSGWAIVIWVVWISLQTGVPAKPAANVARLAPGFEPVFQWPALLAALAATLAWAWLARWRTGRHRAALWKSLVLPAAGATLCWLLLMTLWLPALDYGRSLAAQVRSVAAIVGQGACVNTFALNATQLAALRFHGGWQLEPLPRFDAPATCPWLIAPLTASPSQQQWAQRLEVPRPTDKGDTLLVFARNAADGRP
ncbi:MAG: hypothetical protein ACTTKK_00785 [Ottowia sp.]